MLMLPMDPVVNSQLKGLDTSSSDSLPSTILLEPWGEEDILQSPQSASSLSFSDDSTELPPLKRQKFVLPASSTLSTAATTPSAAPLTLTQPPSAPTCNVPCSSTPLQGNPSPESASLPPFQKARFDVPEILKLKPQGCGVIKAINRNHTLSSTNKKYIANMCTSHLIDLCGYSPSSAMKEAMAQAIVTAFPCLKDPEGKGYETWYIKGSRKRSAKGALEDHLRYRRRKEKVDDESTVAHTLNDHKDPDEEVEGPTATYGDVEKMQALTEWLKHNNGPAMKVRTTMKETTWYRRKFIKPNKKNEKVPNVAEILEKFPHLTERGMIEQDYEELFGAKGNMLYQKWPVVSAFILSYANSMCPKWKTILEVHLSKEQDFTQDERMCLAFCILPLLFEGRKSAKGGRASSKETMDCFIDFQKEGVNLEQYLTQFDGRTQPFVLILGGTYCQPQQLFVIIERKAMVVDTLIAAIDLCYKAYQVLDLCYPPQAMGVWNALDTLIYDIKVPIEPGSIRAFRAYYHFKSSM
ncbi:uncharacterized protein [Apostichopus japonicus]|uniref:uncharacterized protein isoform X2 n=1 Tax=Stichopus japonicus TaxID=307972 RepID=UPI003AB4F34C